MESGLELPIPSSRYNRRPTPKESGLEHEAWVNAGCTPNTPSMCLGFRACPKPNMLGFRQRAWTHFSPLMSPSPTLAKYFFGPHAGPLVLFLSIWQGSGWTSYQLHDLPDITGYLLLTLRAYKEWIKLLELKNQLIIQHVNLIYKHIEF
jgi:hypothetical protein